MRGIAQLRVERANVELLATKLHSLDASLSVERSKSAQIASLMPVQLNPAVHTESQATAAIADTIASLNDLYRSDSTSPIPINGTHPTWARLKQIVQPVPNCLLWSSIQSMQSRNLAQIKQLAIESTQGRRLTDHQSTPRDYLEQFLVRSRAKHIGIELNRMSVAHELERCCEHFMQPYDDFVKRVYSHMDRTEGDYDSNLVEEYLKQFTLNAFNRGQLQFLTDELVTRQAELAERQAQLKDHTTLMAELQTVYAKLDGKFHETRDVCTAMYAIKQKLQALESGAKALVLEARQPSQRALLAQQPGTGRTLNSSSVAPGGGGDSTLGSFNLSNNSVLCSTRLDNSIMVMR